MSEVDVIEQLKHLVHTHKWHEDFEKAFKDIHEHGQVEELSSVVDFPSYLAYLDKFLNWKPSEDGTGFHVYQFLCGFNHILDQPSLKKLQSPVRPSVWAKPPITPLSQWMVNFANAMGNNLSKVGSVTPATLESFENAPWTTYGDPPEPTAPPKPGYRLSEYQAPPGGWTSVSFNELFTRTFPDIDTARPVGYPEDDNWVSNGADSSFDGHWPISHDGLVCFDKKKSSPTNTVKCKGIEWSVDELLAGSQYAHEFAGGHFMHAFLSPADYHRLHAPVRGEIVEAKILPGNVYLQVTLKKDKEGKMHLAPHRHFGPPESTDEITILNAPDDPGYQFSQARGLIIIKNPTLGYVAFLPIGMCQVSSVQLTEGIKEGVTVTKGQELAYFLFGGSDYVMCFQSHVKVDFDCLKQNNWYPVRSAYLHASAT